jgi:mRNA interferase MazF
VKRGDVVTIVLPGAYGKPRPALVIQSELFESLGSVTVLPVTSELRAAPLLRIAIEPSTGNGLRKKSQVMVDKIQTVPRDKGRHCRCQQSTRHLLGAGVGIYPQSTGDALRRTLNPSLLRPLLGASLQ